MTYFAFATVLSNVKKIMTLSVEKDIVLLAKGTQYHITSSHILYVEVFRHKLTIHTLGGDYEARMSLHDMEAQLQDKAFSRCCSGIFVHLKYVDSLAKKSRGFSHLFFEKEK